MDSEQPVTIMVVDQHEEVCESLARSLDRLPGLKVVAHTTNLLRAAELARESPPDLIIADFTWGVAARPDILRWFASVSPGTRFVMYSSYYINGEREAFQAAGASCCLLKGMSIQDLGAELSKTIATYRQTKSPA